MTETSLPSPGTCWGPWTYDGVAQALVYKDGEAEEYYISLDTIASSAGILAWLMHVARKDRFSESDLGHLVRAFATVLVPHVEVGVSATNLELNAPAVAQYRESLGEFRRTPAKPVVHDDDFSADDDV